jgi:hypothetical protein
MVFVTYRYDMPGRLVVANIGYARKGLLLPTYDKLGRHGICNIPLSAMICQEGLLLPTYDIMPERLAIANI